MSNKNETPSLSHDQLRAIALHVALTLVGHDSRTASSKIKHVPQSNLSGQGCTQY